MRQWEMGTGNLLKAKIRTNSFHAVILLGLGYGLGCTIGCGLVCGPNYGAAFASDATPISPARLLEVTARGKQLAAYHKAATEATGVFWKTFPEAMKAGSYRLILADKTAKGWVVWFGTLSEKADKFNAVYEAIEDKRSGKFTAKKCKPGTFDSGTLLDQAKAVQVCLASFPSRERYNNYAILPAKEHSIYVYIYPGQSVAGVYPFGDDVRYTVSTDGCIITETRRMHKSLIQNPPLPKGTTPTMGVHTAVMDDLPEDTDVLHVLVRKPSMGEMIATPHFVYEIDTDGSIKYLGTVEKVLKKQSK